MKLHSLLSLLFTFSSLVAVAEDPAKNELPKVVLLGDSIRMNYQSVAIRELDGKATVFAPKDNCKHTTFVLENLERWLSGQEDARVIHINVGLHDLFLDGKTNKPRHSLELYEDNLRSIFSELQERTDATVIFALTTVVNEKQQAESKGYGRVVRRNSDIDLYNERAKAVAEEFEIEVNDLNQFMRDRGPESILRSSDGIHLSPEGCETMGKEVARIIEEKGFKES